MRILRNTLLAAFVLSAGCIAKDSDDGDAGEERTAPEDGSVATAFASGPERLSPEELERNRMQMDWREWVDRDTTAAATGAAGDTVRRGPSGRSQPGDSAARPTRTRGTSLAEQWTDIDANAVNRGAIALPIYGDVAGPSVVRVQVLLDRAAFSPGIIDGRWGRNTEKAVFWLQRREGLPATGEVDQQTWQRLVQLAAQPNDVVRAHPLTADDVAGPFMDLPDEPYERRNLKCQCYESLAEKLAERFHTTEDLLRELNDSIDLNAVRAGQTLHVPSVERNPGAAGEIARVVVSDGGGYVQALDANNRILYHFPATLGSDYSPSPSGEYRITNVARDPSWHYQPALLEGVPDDKPDAVLPAGPNNAVGTVWMQLSKEHYGIHGTSAPETIGYATSNGCVRLTNWDAEFLGQRVRPPTPVSFRDLRR